MKENIDNDEKMMPFRVHDSRWPILESYRIMPSHRLWRLWPLQLQIWYSHPAYTIPAVQLCSRSIGPSSVADSRSCC